ncbi:MAG: ribonuclease H-like domain-containing protein [Candidatus Kaiserbacteria bacterium]|nr:MAG: ribonuclease H-like domain-containing protein [Candidatus Kaiserbacteria bacterium]
MRTVVFDIETANWMSETGSGDPSDLTIAVVGIHDSETNQYSCFLENELPQLWPILERTDMLVGYNSDYFDIPLLNKYYPGDLKRIKSLDLLQEIYSSLGRRLKLDSVAAGTLGEGKSGDGSLSLKWWKQGEVEKVKMYCQKDVELTKRVFDYALQKGSLKYKDLGTTREIKLDTSKWLVAGAKPMTFTLGL